MTNNLVQNLSYVVKCLLRWRSTKNKNNAGIKHQPSKDSHNKQIVDLKEKEALNAFRFQSPATENHPSGSGIITT